MFYLRYTFFLVVISFISSCSLTNMALNKYNLENIPENIEKVSDFGYTEKSQLIVNFSGSYLGSKKSKKYHFLLDLNGILRRYNQFGKDSIHYLPNTFNANRIYSFDHDFDPKSKEILNIEISKSSVKHGHFKSKIIPLQGKTEVLISGKSFSLDIFDEKDRRLNAEVIQFLPENDWKARNKSYNRISFVLEPTFKRKTSNFLLIAPALAGDIGLIIGQLFLLRLLSQNNSN